MYDWSIEGYDVGMNIDIEILLDDTVGIGVGRVLRLPVFGPDVDGW